MKSGDAARARTILVVEDEPDLRRDLADELREAGYAVLAAADGQEALSILAETRPDLILCDITMPRMDGRDLLRRVREDRPDLADVPFLFLTALADSRDIVMGKRAGADDYLTKPIDYDLLLATVAARLDQVERMRAQAVRSLQDAADQAKRDALRLSTDTLNHVEVAIFLLAGDHRILFANRLAQDMLEAKDGLSGGPTGMLHAETPSVTRALRDAASSTTAEGTHVLLPRPSGGRPLVALVRPLQGGEDGLPAAAILVTDPDRKAGLPAEVIARMYQLTPAETRVALAIADGHRPADIAEMQGTSRTTIVFHLSNVFRKTGTSRQADLVGLFRS